MNVKKPTSITEIICPRPESGEEILATYEVGRASVKEDGLNGRVTFSAETCKTGVRYFLVVGLRLVYTARTETLELAELFAQEKLRDTTCFKGVSLNSSAFTFDPLGVSPIKEAV